MKVIKKMLIACAIASSTVAVAQQSQDSIQYGGWNKYRIGGYGELSSAIKDYGTNRFYGANEGNTKENRATISMPRLVLAGDYKFNKKWILGVEIEFESGGVGTAYELENTENGEYETEIERGGEVALEQFHITRLFHRSLNLRLGHFIVPIGQNNAHHEPINFFGASRPEGETTILPSTWHETGIELFGTFGHRTLTFDYQAQVVSGLNANGFDRNTWAGNAKQGIFEEENFTCPALVARIDYRGLKGLRIGGAMYYCANVGANADKSQTYNGIGKTPVRIYNLEAQYKNQWLETRTNIVWGSLTNSAAISAKNTKLSNKSPYSRLTPIAHHAIAAGCEVGLNIKALTRRPHFPALIPFARYEYYNSQHEVLSPYTAEDRCKVNLWNAGINYRILPGLVAKLDYTSRTIGSGRYNKENELTATIAYIAWFSKK